MPQQPDPNIPEAITLGAFDGLKNIVSAERLGPNDLERALNVDIDDAKQVRRRRGYTLKMIGRYHSVCNVGEKVYCVADDVLGIIRPDYTFSPLDVEIGSYPVCYTEVDNYTYFSSGVASGVISPSEAIAEWGHTDGQGTWLSPVHTPTETLGEVSGSLLGDPPSADCLAAYKGRIYLGSERLLWATQLFLYHYVDRTRNFIQFEHDITLLMAAGDGLYVGTTGGLYFLQGTFETFKLSIVVSDAVLPGSGVRAPADLVHPQARNGPVPTSDAALMMTAGGILACFDGGNAFNLTQDRVIFPSGVSAAGLFRQDQGANSYVAAVDSAGGPAANTRIGDYVDAEIVRFGGA